MEKTEIKETIRENKPFTDSHECDAIASELGFYGYGGLEYDLSDESDDFLNASANPKLCFTKLCRTRKKYYKSQQSYYYQKYKKTMSRRKAKKKSRAKANWKAWDKYPKASFKENWVKARDRQAQNLKDVGSAIAGVSLFPIRKAFLGLVQINYRGIATKIANTKKSNQKKMDKKWKTVGGKTKTFWKVVNKGAKKKPFFCGKKCKNKLKSSFDGKDSNYELHELMADIDNTLYFEGAVTIAAVGAWVGTASSIMALIKPLITPSKEGDKIDKDEKAVGGGEVPSTIPAVDPKTEISNNPNLTPEEKKEAKKQLDSILGGDYMTYGLIGVGVVLLGVLGYFMFNE